MPNPGISRRHVLGWGTASLAAAFAGLPAWSSGARRQPSKAKAKNIIFCVSDGMSLGTLSMADQYRFLRDGVNSVWASLMKAEGVVHGLMDTRSLSSLVTDSAAASSAWGSGVHVVNGMLNAHPGGEELTPILRLFADRARMRTGLVTTATLSHATPAGWTISHPKRDEERAIAEKYLTSGVDVFLGGGDQFFGAAEGQSDLYEAFAKIGYRIAKSHDEMEAVAEGKILGVFSRSHLPYEVDRLNDEALKSKVPSIAEMTRKAIALLDGSPEGFVLQVEGARVDHAAHGNDAAGLLFDQLAFEDAVDVAMDFAQRSGDTLVVITSDHGNSNPGLNGGGGDYGDSVPALHRIGEARASYAVLMPKLTASASPDALAEVVEADLGVRLSGEEAALAFDAVQGRSAIKAIGHFGSGTSMLSKVLSNHLHIGWTSGSHTSDLTAISAFGPGAEAFGGIVANVDVFGKLLAHRDIAERNPAITLEEARRRMGASAALMGAEPVPHWV